MLYAVTGGTGFLGEHVVRELVEEGHSVRIIARSKPAAPLGRNTEVFAGSITDESVLKTVFDGVDGVFHLAGVVEHSRRKEDFIYDIHVGGTMKIMEKAKELRVRRVVYASTSGTVAVSTSPEHVADDHAPYAKDIVKNWPYYNTKVIAEEKARQYAKEVNIELVCMRPTLLLGPGDRRLSSCRSIVDLLEQKVPFVPCGGLSFVDVRDAAKAFVVAMAKGKPGSTYLLGAENMLLSDYFKRVEALSGVPSPWLRVPNAAAWAMAASANGLSGLFGRWDPSLDPVVVEMAQHFWYLDATKARQDLGFMPRDSAKTLKDTIEWLVNHRSEVLA